MTLGKGQHFFGKKCASFHEQTDESDVDIALILDLGYTKAMTKKMYRCVAQTELDTGKTLSVVDIDATRYDTWKEILPFYKNIEREGITLWTRI